MLQGRGRSFGYASGKSERNYVPELQREITNQSLAFERSVLSSTGNRRTTKRRMTAQLPLLIIFGLLIFPQVPAIPIVSASGLDAGWMTGLNMAVARNMLFGRDIMFTYGPLGYLAFPSFPEANPQIVRIFTLSWYIFTVYLFWKLLSEEDITLLCGIALIVSTAAIFFLDFSIWNRNVFRIEIVGILIALNILIAHRGRRAIWLDIALLATVTGVAMLVKISMALSLASLGICLAVFCSLDAKRIGQNVPLKNVAALLPMPASVLVFYYLIEGNFAHFTDYLRASWELISGYPDAMSVSGDESSLTIIGGAILILIAATRHVWKDWRTSMDALLAAAIVVFFAYKNFVVRQDILHAPPIFFELALAAILLMTRIHDLRRQSLVAWVSLVFVGCGVAFTVRPFKPDLSTVVGNMTNLPARIFSYVHLDETAGRLAEKQLEFMDSYRLPESLRHRIGKSTVVIFPSDILIAKANELTWNPRPIFQSYSAYTPYLDHVNATHVEQRGPAMAIISWGSIDGRLPFIEEPLTWMTLLNYYDFEYQTPELILVRRRLRPKFIDRTAEGEVVADWNESVRVPITQPGEFAVMKARIATNIAGKVTDFLFRPTRINATLTLANGIVSGRLIRANSESGMILSPFPSAQSALAKMFDCWSRPKTNDVASIRFDTPAPWQFQPKIHIQWFRLRCAASR
jgi:hypothetical protein